MKYITALTSKLILFADFVNLRYTGERVKHVLPPSAGVSTVLFTITVPLWIPLLHLPLVHH